MCFSVHGKQYRLSTETKDYKVAEKILKKIETQIAEGKWLEINNARYHDFDELMQKYLAEHSKVNKAESTYSKDVSMKKHLEKDFQCMTLDRITSEAIVSYKNKRLAEGAAQSTVKNELGMLNNAFNIAQHTWKWMRDNPFTGLKLGLKANTIDRWLTAEEEKLLLKSAENKLYGMLPDIIVLDVNVGLSQEEILKLKWGQIDFSRKTLTTIRKKTKKKDRPARTIPLNATATEILKHRAKIQSMSGYVFFNTAGNRIDAGKLKRKFGKAVNCWGMRTYQQRSGMPTTFANR